MKCFLEKDRGTDDSGMDQERILKWIFEAPEDVVLPEEFEQWEREEMLKEIHKMIDNYEETT